MKIIYILAAILIFGFLIAIHELGHFVAAKLCGVRVNEFSIGMGPEIFSRVKGETQYSLRLLPLGGFCAMEGEDNDTDNPRSFQKATWWKRIIILAAGSFMNLLIGILIVAVVLFTQPRYTTTEIVHVEQWSTLAQENGLKAGDTILSFNGEDIVIYEDFKLATMLLPDGEYEMKVLRDGSEITLPNVPMTLQPVDDGNGGTVMLYGISFGVADTTAGSVPERILPTAWNYVDSVIISLKMLLNGQAKVQDMTGAVGLVHIMAESAERAETVSYAVINLLGLGGFIAINLAVMDLLPIPALDGGRIVGLLLTVSIEKIIRKKLDPKYEGYVHGVGMILLLLLMAVITFKDIFMIFKG
jgi:regulator of sigma E protease